MRDQRVVVYRKLKPVVPPVEFNNMATESKRPTFIYVPSTTSHGEYQYCDGTWMKGLHEVLNVSLRVHSDHVVLINMWSGPSLGKSSTMKYSAEEQALFKGAAPATMAFMLKDCEATMPIAATFIVGINAEGEDKLRAYFEKLGFKGDTKTSMSTTVGAFRDKVVPRPEQLAILQA